MIQTLIKNPIFANIIKKSLRFSYDQLIHCMLVPPTTFIISDNTYCKRKWKARAPTVAIKLRPKGTSGVFRLNVYRNHRWGRVSKLFSLLILSIGRYEAFHLMLTIVRPTFYIVLSIHDAAGRTNLLHAILHWIYVL